MGQILLPKQYHPDFSALVNRPIGPVSVDWSNPISRGLVGALPNQSSVVENAGAGVRKASQYGLGYSSDTNTSTSGYDLSNTRPVAVDATTDFTIFVAFHRTVFGAGGAGAVLYAERPNGTQILKLARVVPSSLSFVSRDSSNANLSNLELVVAQDTGRAFHTALLSCAAGSSWELRADDNAGTITRTLGPRATLLAPTICYDPFDSRSDPDQTVLVVYTFNRVLSDAEYKSLQRDPYQLLKPATPQTYTFPAAVGAININAATDTLIISEQGAVVQADVDISITAGVDSLVISEQGANVQADVDILISANADTLVITENSATVQSDVDINVAANSDTLVISENAATVQLITGISILATTNSLLISEQAAVVQADVDITITAGVDSLILSELQAAITLDVGVTIDGTSNILIDTNFQSHTLYFNDENYFTIT